MVDRRLVVAVQHTPYVFCLSVDGYPNMYAFVGYIGLGVYAKPNAV